MKLEKRIEVLQTKLGESSHPQVQLLETKRSGDFNGISVVQQYLDEVVKKGGKGALLRRPGSFYFDDKSVFKYGVSVFCLKIK